MAGNVIELTDATFDQIVRQSEEPVLVDFSATWCGPCKMLAPIIEEIAGDYIDKAKVCKVDIGEAPKSAAEFDIRGVPTTILFRGGEQKKKWVGLTSKKEIVSAIDDIL